jgi:glycosyltransferase involved in cell wall biosynthesis
LRVRVPRRLPDRPSLEAPGPGPVVFVLPARDEVETVAGVVERIPAQALAHPVTCVVVDDGSTDGTASAAGAAGATVVATPGLGLGAAMRIGLSEAVGLGAAAVVFCDADGEYDPEEMEALVTPVLTGRADYVVGSRFAGRIDRMRWYRRLGNRLLTGGLAWIARVPITDGQSGYRALSGHAAAAAEIIHDYNYAQVLTLDLVAKGYRYGEVPISYAFRRTGRSFVKPLPYLRRVIPAVWRELNPSVPDATGDPTPAATG